MTVQGSGKFFYKETDSKYFRLCEPRGKIEDSLFFWLHHAACRILVPGPRIEPMLPAVEAQGLNHWTTGEVPI